MIQIDTEFQLGQPVRDQVTKQRGIVTGISVDITGRVTIQLSPQASTAYTFDKPFWVDQIRLTSVHLSDPNLVFDFMPKIFFTKGSK